MIEVGVVRGEEILKEVSTGVLVFAGMTSLSVFGLHPEHQPGKSLRAKL